MLARWNLPVISFILNLVSSPLYDSVSFSFLKQHLLHQSRAFHLVSHGHRSAGSTPQPNRSAAALSSCWDAYPPSLSNQSARNLWIPAPPEAVGDSRTRCQVHAAVLGPAPPISFQEQDSVDVDDGVAVADGAEGVDAALLDVDPARPRRSHVARREVRHRLSQATRASEPEGAQRMPADVAARPTPKTREGCYLSEGGGVLQVYAGRLLLLVRLEIVHRGHRRHVALEVIPARNRARREELARRARHVAGGQP
eukprot:331979-Rhodomonas_salina.2